MTPPDLFDVNRAERYKGGIHLALFGLACVCAAYNLGALLVRPNRRLAINAALYGGLVALEATQVQHHWRPACLD